MKSGGILIVTKQPEDWIDMKSRPAPPKGDVKPGFKPMLTAWCKAKGIALPNLGDRKKWVPKLPAGVNFREATRVRQVFGVKFASESMELPRLSWKHPLGGMHSSWLLFEGVAVFMHMFVFVWSSLILVLLAIGIQDIWATTVAPPMVNTGAYHVNTSSAMWPYGIGATEARSHGRTLCVPCPLIRRTARRACRRWHWLARRYTICPLSQIVLWEAISFMAATIIRMIWTYANPPFGALMRNMVVNVYGSVLILHCLYLFILIGLFSCWFILAAVVRPEQYLPYGTAVIVLFVTMRLVGSELWAYAKRVAAQAKKALDAMLSHKLRRAREQIELTAFTRIAREHAMDTKGEDADDFETPLGPKWADEQMGEASQMKSGKVDAADIFAVLKEARDAELGDDEQEEVAKADAIADDPDAIGKADFARLFKSLDLHFTDAQFERLFAMTDLDGNGNVTLQEFEGAWDVLVKELLAESVREMGLSDEQIALSILTVFLALLLLLASSVLPSGTDAGGRLLCNGAGLLVGTVGRGIYSVRKRAASSDNPEELENMVDVLVGEKAAAAGG